ncbi:hypothetical protein [[Phormidium] sp. ETS-05]|uniref:hypothetical protein n=1 Tax=[Phormidium] sp. ETS-05 TaxID=222819 RepID=UPI0035C8A83B
MVTAANQLGTVKRFFHWPLEFPEVFQSGGFDCLLGNPPWELLQLAEKEFFAARSAEIANAANKAAREKLIKQLPKTNPELAQAWEDAQHDAEAQNKFIRESGRFPLTAVGKINTYAVFTETARKLISSGGRAGVIVPTGIATADTTKNFFESIVISGQLDSLFDFFEIRKFFSGSDSREGFCLLVIRGNPAKTPTKFVFKIEEIAEISKTHRIIEINSADIALMNPNTLTCPVFRTRTDAELTKKIYQRVPVLENERTSVNPWGISFMQGLFNMASDSGLFQSEAGDGLVPLYEAKMFWHYDHRYATYCDGATQPINQEDKINPHYLINPRYWVSRTEVENRLGGKWDKEWLLAFRDICRSTDERTAIFSVLPKIGVGHTAPILLSDLSQITRICCLLGIFNSLIFDFITRQKLGGTHLTFTALRQLPVLPPEAYTPEDINFIAPRVIELVYTAWDIKPFAEDMWRGSQKPQNSPSILTTTTDSEQLRLNLNLSEPQPEPPTPAESSQNQIQLRRLILEQWQSNQQASPITDPLPPTGPLDPETDILPIPPFIWNSDRRAVLRAELDAYYGKLYGITRDELRYILDPADVHGPDFPSETFRVLKNNETKEFGEYRTQRLVLAAWDRMFGKE